MIHSEHKSTDGGTTCEFEMARRISNHGYETKVYYPYGTVVSGIYDKFATLEDVNETWRMENCEVVDQPIRVRVDVVVVG